MLVAALVLLAAAEPPASPPIEPLVPGFSPLAKGSIGAQFGIQPLGFALPQVPAIGITYFVADRIAARLDFGLDAVFANCQCSTSGGLTTYSIGIGVRFYAPRAGPVAVFAVPSAAFGREFIGFLQALGTPQQPLAAEYVSFGAALGVEYFFTEHLSAGGTLGAALKVNGIGGPTGTSVGTELTTSTSALFLAFYF